ncbi:MAG: hypothetical protein ACTSRK_17815 [Promethearchaeota archaeon]
MNNPFTNDPNHYPSHNPNHNSNNPFFAIFILDSNSGVELVSHSFENPRIDLDVDALSGMFKALELFINNMAYSDQFEAVQEINFHEKRIVYERYGPPNHQILCVGVSRKVISTKKEHYVLKAIVRDFYETYRPQLQNFVGEVKYFENFYPILENIPTYFSNLIPYYNPGYSSTSPSSGSRLFRQSRHSLGRKMAGTPLSPLPPHPSSSPYSFPSKISK